MEQREPFVSNELNLAHLERQAILRALQISGFDKSKAARQLGIGKTTLYRKLKDMSGKKTAISSSSFQLFSGLPAGEARSSVHRVS